MGKKSYKKLDHKNTALGGKFKAESPLPNSKIKSSKKSIEWIKTNYY